jgi:exopolyphosphatase/pppGpp-phosphohydrolase
MGEKVIGGSIQTVSPGTPQRIVTTIGGSSLTLIFVQQKRPPIRVSFEIKE